MTHTSPMRERRGWPAKGLKGKALLPLPLSRKIYGGKCSLESSHLLERHRIKVHPTGDRKTSDGTRPTQACRAGDHQDCRTDGYDDLSPPASLFLWRPAIQRTCRSRRCMSNEGGKHMLTPMKGRRRPDHAKGYNQDACGNPS